MLKFSGDQFRAISESLVEDFVEKTTRHLLRHFREQLARHGVEDDVAAFVKKGLTEAGSYGITQASDVRLYIECMVLLRPDFSDFPEYPWAAKILREEGLSGTEKMDQIHEQLVFSVLLNPEQGVA